MRRDTSGPDWLGACCEAGLHDLSPPEVEGSIAELATERPAFLRLVERAAGWPSGSPIGARLPEPADMDRLDRRLPRSRAVVDASDEAALLLAGTLFRCVLVLDPFWMVRGLLYAAWHDPHGLAPDHAAVLQRMVLPGLRLAPLIQAGAIQCVPDHLPGSWEPWPMRTDSIRSTPGLEEPFATHLAARLVYWADRLRAVAVVGRAEVAVPLRALGTSALPTGPEGSEAGMALAGAASLADLIAERWATPHRRWGHWGRIFDRQTATENPRATSLAASLRRMDRGGESRSPWIVGVGPETLPDMSLVLRRAAEGRDLCSGNPGLGTHLRRRFVYLVPGAAATEQ